MKRAKILSASAGSGKTFQLALKYICDIIERPDAYRNILAVTFTNKATEEMKSRILGEIHKLASGYKSPYIDIIRDKMDISEEMIRERALIARNKILHDFSRFNVLTIDKFFQRILRAFIKELGIDLNYEIELDIDMILEQSAESLIGSIPTESGIRSWLYDFAEEKLAENGKWDIRGELCSLGHQLFGESGAKKMKKNISKEDLQQIVKLITKDADSSHERIIALGNRALEIMKEYGVDPTMFKYANKGGPAEYFNVYARGELPRLGKRALSGLESVTNWYNKGCLGNVICAAEKLMPILQEISDSIEKCIEKKTTAELVCKQYRSFALLVDLQRCISNICDEENIMILSETKDILAKFIDDNNAPFIYEKIGNRYDHYMIDEFQDTTIREWQNMLPLLKEALASNSKASIFIVGDIKQSIYRWRGGHWRLLNQEALEDLGREETCVEHLKQNYRSLENVVKFNNAIIRQIVDIDNNFLNNTLQTALDNNKIGEATYEDNINILKRAYSDHEQVPAIKSDEKGYVEVCAYDPALTASPFIEAIESTISRGYRYCDILILVRDKGHAKEVAKTLLEYKKEKFTSQGLSGFNIMMADALTLENCDIVEFITAVLNLSINPNNDIDRGLHNRYLHRDIDQKFDDDDKAYFGKISHMSPMEAFEDIVKHYNLSDKKESIAYLQAMHEQVVEFSTSRTADIHQFLTWWTEHGKKVNVSVEMADDTIEITTIHKAKGLERKVIIIPKASWNIHPSPKKNPIVWAEADDKNIAHSIGRFPVPFEKAMGESAFSEHYYKEFVMNHVDTLNLIYVALTRASMELYVYTPFGINAKDTTSNISTSGKLIVDAVRLVCPEPKTIIENGAKKMIYYRYGSPLKSGAPQKLDSNTQDILLDNYISTTPSIQVRFPAQRHIDEDIPYNDSMGMGIRLHSIFEKARNVEDIRSAIHTLVLNCLIDETEADMLQQKIDMMLAYPIVGEWFNNEWDDVKCEAGIMSECKDRRPDRVMIKGDRAVVVDYKFGDKRSESYKAKMEEYIDLLGKMNRYNCIEGYIWYVALGDVVKVK